MVAKIHTDIIYPLKNPKKNPKIVSTFPIPEYLTALLIPLFIISIIKITIINIPIPKIISKTYSLSIIPLTKGLIFGNKIRVTTYANNHLDAARTLNTKPFLVHLIKDNNVIVK